MKQREEKGNRLQNELCHILESLAVMLSTPIRFVESQEASVKDRIREIFNENKDMYHLCMEFIKCQEKNVASHKI